MTQSAASHRAARALVDLAAIVVGVLLALGVDQWWERHQEQELEALYLERLLEDIAVNRDLASRTAQNQARVLEAAERTYGRLKAGEAPRDEAREAVIEAYRATQTFLPGFVDDVYEELLSTGNIRLIRSPTLRGQIFAYRRRLRPPPEFAFASLEYRDRVRGILAPDLKLEIRRCIRGDCALSISEAEAEAALARLFAEPGLDRALSLVVEQWARGAGYLVSVGEASDSLEAAVQAVIR